jgi:low temperature requirement protein LtrA
VQRAAFWTFYPISVTAALVVLIGGLVGGITMIALFAIGGALDLLGAANAGRGTWAVDAVHFAERNGLFIIIALGESVVGLGLTAAGVELDSIHVSGLMVSFVGVATLWWAYFDRAAPQAERHFTRLTGKRTGRFARDAYTVLHYPIVVGIVFFAVGLEQVVAHPSDVLTVESRLTIAAGSSLVLASIVAITFLATRRLPPERLIAAVGLLALIWLGAQWEATLFASVTVGVTIVALIAERNHPWPAPGDLAV